jgi:hypothetical protein
VAVPADCDLLSAIYIPHSRLSHWAIERLCN